VSCNHRRAEVLVHPFVLELRPIADAPHVRAEIVVVIIPSHAPSLAQRLLRSLVKNITLSFIVV
jgi:hypothetical protein